MRQVSKVVTFSEDTPKVRPPEPLTRLLRQLRFRYYDGTTWQDSWSLPGLPSAVEITLGADAPPPEGEGETKTEIGAVESEIFRRTVYLPGSGAESDDMILARLLGVPEDMTDTEGGEEDMP
jgi:hypothetical protein